MGCQINVEALAKGDVLLPKDDRITPLGFNFLAAEHLVTVKTKCMTLVELLKKWSKYEKDLRDISQEQRKGVLKCMKDLTDYINKTVKHDGMRCPNCKTMNLHEANSILCCSFCGDNADADKMFLQRFEQMNEELNIFLRLSNEESKQKIRQTLIDLHSIIIS